MPDSTDAAEDELIAVDDPTAKTLKRIASIGNIDGGSASSTYLASQIIDGGDEA